MVLANNLTLLQVGNRTNLASAKHLMDNDLLGTEKFGVVKNLGDTSSERSHLDTFFNIVDPNTVIMLNFDDPEVPREAKRVVDLYRQTSQGNYVIESENVDFEEFLKSQGYKVIKASRREQQELMIGFLHLGKTETNYVLLSCNPHLQELLQKNEIKDVEV